MIDPYRALYPENRAVSYIPFRQRNVGANDMARYGCTRLDFFLISPELLDSINSISYEDRLGSDFDHKEVVLKLGRKKSGARIVIRDATLNNGMANDMMLMTVYENIVNNFVVADGGISDNLAQLNILLKEKENILGLIAEHGNDNVYIHRTMTVEANIVVIKGRLPPIRELLGREFVCNYRTLYEGIIMGIKNSLMNIQTSIDKNNRRMREQLLHREEYVKGIFGENSQQWYDAREAILRHDDANLKDTATKFREFLDTNNEKATKAFCRLSKEGGLCDDISQIKKENSDPFESNEKREKFISDYYSNIYKKKIDRLMRIEDYLFNGVEDLDEMNNKKLDAVEQLELENIVTLDEVKRALDESNFDSSSGWDGISFRVIRKFWEALKDPMLKMIQETFENRELMETFKLGLIKLIPKKGDANKVGDWRPITLLCCGYKLISGIVANRIGKYLPKLIGRSQKGFMSNKNINTCTVNVMNSISRSWETSLPTGIMCVDFAKAFDSVEHEMITNVLKFFGFGEFMVGMVSTLLTDRKSRIIFEGGYSEDVIIGRGTPQGDRSSPYIFILCIEILIMKINRMEGNGIDDSGLYVDIVRNLDGLEKPTSETYADDLTIIFKMSGNSVEIILMVLGEFELVSGLSINIGKTQLMVTGSDEWAPGMRIHGVKVVDKVTILGITIDRKLEKLDDNWDTAIGKMERLAWYWTTFTLSITGRVMVAKTYLLSQCIYLMGSLPLKDNYGDRINEILLDFVKGRDRLIERRRQLLCPALGGYGLVDAKVMNVCMKAAWIERWKREMPFIDYMVATAWNINEDNGTRDIKLCDVVGKGLPIMEDIVRSWIKFKNKFYEWGNNIYKAELFGNEALLREGRKIEEIVFTEGRYIEIGEIVRDSTVRDICAEGGGIRDKIQVERNIGIAMTWVEYFRLRTEVTQLMLLHHGGEGRLTTEQTLDEFMTGRKRGCKRYRKIMEGKNSRIYEENTPVNIAAGNTLWGEYMGQMGRELIERNYKLWSCASLESCYKDFLFKLVHGKLYLNNQLANFADVRRECTFCTIQEEKQMRNENVMRNSPEYMRRISNLSGESVSHLLWGCRWVNSIIESTFNRLTGEINRHVDVNRYMGGWLIENNMMQETVLIVIHYVKYVIYVCRNRRVLPSVVHLRYEVEELLREMQKRKKWGLQMGQLGDNLMGIFQE